MSNLIQILKVDEPRSGVSKKSGTPFTTRSCQCILLDETGELGDVGVLRLPKDMVSDETAPKPGVYMCNHKLGVSYDKKEIGLVITSLVPYDLRKMAPVAPAPAAAKTVSQA